MASIRLMARNSFFVHISNSPKFYRGGITMKIKKICIIVAAIILAIGYFALSYVKASYKRARKGPQHDVGIFNLIEKPVSDLSREESRELFKIMDLKIPENEESVYIKTLGIVLSPNKEHKNVFVELDGIKDRDSFVELNNSLDPSTPAIYFFTSWDNLYIDGTYRYYLAFEIHYIGESDEEYMNSIFSAYEELKALSGDN